MFNILLLFLVFGALCYHKIPVITSCIIMAVYFTIAMFSGLLGVLASLIGLATVAALAYVINHDDLRREKFVRPIYTFLKKTMPPISETERTALESGGAWWDKELFSGNPNWQKLLNMPAPTLSKDELSFLDGPVEKLCRQLNDWEINYLYRDLTPSTWEFLKNERFFGLMIPQEYGGHGFSELAHSEILAKIAGCSTAAASIVAVPNSLGPAELIVKYGTQQQKTYYLPRLAKGLEIPCFGLTNPNAGSDATAIPDHGIVCKDKFEGKTVLGVKINWDKRYITLAPIATVFGIAFKLYDPEKLLGEQEDIGITCALIPRKTKGLIAGKRHLPLTCMFQNGPTQGKDVFVPIDYIIGGPQMAGQGWKMLVECLATGRAISLPSAASGKARTVAALTGAYARIRNQFGTYIGKFEGIQEKLAHMASTVYITEAARRNTATSIDLGEKPVIPGAILKYHITEMGRQVGIDAMDVHAGKAVIMGPKNPIADGYINSPIGVTVEGANILTRNLIIFGQGSVRAHPYLMQELESLQMQDHTAGLKLFDEIFMLHFSDALATSARASFSSLTFGKFIFAPVKHKGAKFYKQISWGSYAFATISGVCLAILGGKFKFKESLSARLGDMLSMLYLASMALKRYENEGQQEEDFALLEYSITQLMSNFWQAAFEVIQNFPIKSVAIIMRILIMPWGRPINSPSLKLKHKIAKLLLSPSNTRERLLAGAYKSNNANNPLGQYDLALKQVIAAEDVERKLNKIIAQKQLSSKLYAEQIIEARNKKLISDAEQMLLQKAHELRGYIIEVDDFSQKEIANLARNLS